MENFCHIDFETRSAVDLFKAGADVYSQHETTDAMCLAYTFGDEEIELWHPELPPPKRLLDHVKKGFTVFGHNIGNFEMLIWNNVMALKYDWPELKIEQCEDTMAMAYAMSLPGSLDDASRAAGIPYQKDMKGNRIMLQLSKPRAYADDGSPIWWEKKDYPEKFEQLYEYCKMDVQVERALGRRLLRLSPFERKIWQLDYKINRRGVYVDIHSAQIAIALVASEKKRLDNRMREVTGNAVASCNATGQIADWLKSQGLSVPSLAKADVTEMLSRSDLPPAAKEALLLRQEAAKTSTAKLTSMINGASIGNRVRGLFQYHGASTGRWAGRRVQLQNLPRQTFDQETINEIFTLLNKYGVPAAKKIRELVGSPTNAISECVRGFLTAKPGHDFIAVDFSAIEARIIAWLAGEEKVLVVFRGDGKIYELTAAGVFAVKMSEITKDDFRRQVGKVVVLSMGFAGGVGALQTMCRGYGVKLEPIFDIVWNRSTEEQRNKTRFLWNLKQKESDISQKEFFASDLIKQFWREDNPKIVQYWTDLQRASIAAVQNPGQKFTAGAAGREIIYKMNGSFLWCRLPSGRVLCYPYPEIKMLKPFDEDSVPVETLTYMGVDSYTHKWQRQKSYGGLLAENVTQAVSADLLRESMINLEDNGYPVVMHIHDEDVTEIPENFGSTEEVEKICERVPSWAAGLPIKAEAWRGKRFKK